MQVPVDERIPRHTHAPLDRVKLVLQAVQVDAPVHCEQVLGHAKHTPFKL